MLSRDGFGGGEEGRNPEVGEGVVDVGFWEEELMGDGLAAEDYGFVGRDLKT